MTKSEYVIRLWHHCLVLLSSLSLATVNSAPGHIVNASEFICGIYIGKLPSLMHMRELAYDIHMAFERHICLWHIFCSSIVNKCCRFLICD